MYETMKILILEDSDTDAELVQRLLRKENPHIQFSVVMTREEFVGELNEFQPDVILSDNSMPGFSAADALTVLKAHTKKIPFILVTGTVSEEFAAGIIKQGADDYFLKDRLARLPAAIEAAIREKKSEQEKNEATQRLATSEERYRSLYERNHAGVYRTTFQGTILSCNFAFAAMFGYDSPAALEQKNASILYFSDTDRASFTKYLTDHKEVANYEIRLKHKNGSVVYGLENISVYQDAATGQEIIEGVLLDITQHKKADEALKKSFQEKEELAERMSNILNTLPANIALLDEKGIIIDVNDCWRHFAGQNSFIGSSHAIGENYIKVTAAAKGNEKEDGKFVSMGIKSVLNKLTDSFEYEYPSHTNKEERWFRMIVTPLLEREQGGVVVMHLNITEQKKNAVALEATLKELSNYKIALDESSIVSITDPKGVITYVNKNFCEISKYSASELLGKNHRIVSSGFHEIEFVQQLWKTILSGSIWRNEVKNKAKDGTFYWVDATIVPFLDAKKKPLQFVAINKDITERKLIEQELVRQKVLEHKKISRAMLAAQEKERNHLGEELHDNINQLLAGAKLYLGMAATKSPELKELAKYPIELIEESIEEIRMLCHRLVTPLKNIDLDQMIKDFLVELNKTTTLKAVYQYSPISTAISDDLKINIYRIIQESMNNVVKYAQAKNVTISIADPDNKLHITITDDGIGFDVKAKRKGIGISNMAHRIESYNGIIDVISSPGKGTTIDINIPH